MSEEMRESLKTIADLFGELQQEFAQLASMCCVEDEEDDDLR